MIDFTIVVDWISMSIPFLVLFGFVWAPKSWTPGELVTAASMNTNIRDHLNEAIRVQTVSDTGTEDDFAIDGPFAWLRCTNSAALTITGALLDSGNIDGTKIIIEATDATVTLLHQDAGSVAGNRFITQDEHMLVIIMGQRAQLIYDATTTRWRAAHSTTGDVTSASVGPNLLGNPDFLIWPAGDAAAPAYWAIVGGGDATLARDTGETVHGHFGLELTWVGASTTVAQHIFNTGDFPGATWEGKHFSIVCRAKATTINQARIEINDGVATTVSDFHTGGGDFELLAVTHEISPSATQIRVGMTMAVTGNVIIFDFPTAVEGLIQPDGPRPCPSSTGTLGFLLPGDPVLTGTSLIIYSNPRPFFVNHVQVQALSAVSGTDLVIDVNHWDGAALQSIFGGAKIILAQASSHQRQGKVPDGTYRYRCFAAAFGSARVADGEVSVDIDTAPTGGKNPLVELRGIQYQRPYESLLDFDHVE